MVIPEDNFASIDFLDGQFSAPIQVDREQFEPWFKVYRHGHEEEGRYLFYRVKHALLIVLEDPTHEEMLRPLFTDGICIDKHDNLASGVSELRCTQRVFPWELPPWIRGFGPLWVAAENGLPHIVKSTDIINKIKGVA